MCSILPYSQINAILNLKKKMKNPHLHTSKLLGMLIVFLFLAHHKMLAQNKNTFIQDSLDHYINNAMKIWNIPGVAIAIIKNDSIVYSKGFGFIEVDKRNKVNTSTLFPIWSMGKSFTAFSLALLEDRNHLKLDDKISDHFQTFKMNNKNYENEMNITDLLSHRMGIETFQGDFLWSETSLSTEQLLEKWSNFSPTYPIRSGFQYSNYGYLIAGQVIESVSKKKWQKFLTDEVLKPLQMNQSILFVDELNLKKNIAKGHVKVDHKITPLAKGESIKIEPFGGMYTSVDEMIVWIQLHLNKGIINNKSIFAERIFDRVHKPYNIVGKMYLPDGSSPNVNYGLGWEIREYHGKEIVTHGGAYNGFLSMMGFVPNEKLGFVILTNSDAHELTEALKWQIIDAYFNRKYVNHAVAMFNYSNAADVRRSNWLTKISDSLAENRVRKIPLKKFEGMYQNNIYGSIKVKQIDAHTLELKFEHHPKLTATLKHLGDNRFFCEYSQAMFGKVIIPFLEKNNEVDGFELTMDSFVEFTPYYFTKLK